MSCPRTSRASPRSCARQRSARTRCRCLPVPGLEELRELSRTSAPAATEALKWGHRAYSLSTILLVYSAHRHHLNFVFTPSTREAFAVELAGFITGRGSVQLPYDKPVPRDLLARMIAYRIRELEVHNVLWRRPPALTDGYRQGIGVSRLSVAAPLEPIGQQYGPCEQVFRRQLL